MTSARSGILLVEDDPAYVELIQLELKRSNAKAPVHVARDGVAALDFLFHKPLEQSPRVILLDLKLPGMDGLQVLREIKAAEQTRAIPVVILSSSTREDDIIASYRLGANSYVQKPLDFLKFRQVVNQLGAYWLTLNHTAPLLT